MAPVDDTDHALLHQHVVVTKQRVNRLLVDVAALVAVHHNLGRAGTASQHEGHLVVVTGLENHVKDGLVEFVLDQEVCVEKPLEYLKDRMTQCYCLTSTTWW